MNALRPGICGVCDITPIIVQDPKTGRWKATDDYTEITLVLSDHSIARHGICKGCIVSLTDQKIALVFQRIQATWNDEMVGWATDKQFTQMRALTHRAWDFDDHGALEKLKQIKIKDHQDKLEQAKKGAKDGS